MNKKLNIMYIKNNLFKFKKLDTLIKPKLNKWINDDNKKDNLFKSDHSFSVLEMLDFKTTEDDYNRLVKEYGNYIEKNKDKLNLSDYIGLEHAMKVKSENYIWRMQTLFKLNSYCELAIKNKFTEKKIFNKIKNNLFTFIFEMDFVKYCNDNNISIVPEPKVSNKTPDFFIVMDKKRYIIDCSIEHIKEGTGPFIHKIYSKLKDKYKKYENTAKKINSKIIYVTTDLYTIEMYDFHLDDIMLKLKSEKLEYLKGIFVFNKSNNIWKYYDLEL